MKIKLQSLHFDADQKLIDFIEKKADKLAKLYENIVGIEVILKLDNDSKDENKVVEMKVEIPGNDLFSKKQCRTFEEAADQCVDALKTQLVKFKEKQRGE
ncbi:MAG TPA: ribosome-associated translation inhibitor RaiA [Bacteroidales bacterium]|nr:ribosome-associated translation inhibitor RaiA [Bacteroidales bacterium]